MKRRLALVLGSAVVLSACSDATDDTTPRVMRQGNPSCPDPIFPARSDESRVVDVPMRDCVRLSTSISFPDTPGPWPVIMIRTPYGKGGGSALGGLGVATLFTPYGYAVVEQDVRGRFDSEGDFIPFLNERADSADTLAWVERQSWFDGNLGVWGASYLGATALLATVERPDLVKAAYIAVITSEIYSVAYEHGLLKADVGGSWALIMHDKHSLSMPTEKMQQEAMLKFPLAEADLRTVGSVAFDDPFFEHNTNDALYLDQLTPQEWQETDVPLLMVTGWFDFMSEGQLRDYDALFERRAGKDLFLTLGPWNHLMGFQPTHDYAFDDYRALMFYLDQNIRFFDHYVRGLDVDLDIPPVQYYDGGQKSWKVDAALWPSNQKEVTWYASELSGAHDCSAIGKLSTTVGQSEQASYVYDPYDPVMLNGSMVLNLNGKAGMQKEIDWCARPDALLFESPVFASPTELAGAINVRLSVSSSAEDSAFFARLSLVDVDGTAYNLREGAMVLSYRDGDDKRVDYTPGEKVSLRFELPALRWTLQPGQKLRLAVSNSGYPFVVPHPNVAGDWLNAPTAVTATQTLYAGGNAATSITLTIAE